VRLEAECFNEEELADEGEESGDVVLFHVTAVVVDMEDFLVEETTILPKTLLEEEEVIEEEGLLIVSRFDVELDLDGSVILVPDDIVVIVLYALFGTILMV
jgi:hypothetical protein